MAAGRAADRFIDSALFDSSISWHSRDKRFLSGHGRNFLVATDSRCVVSYQRFPQKLQHLLNTTTRKS